MAIDFKIIEQYKQEVLEWANRRSKEILKENFSKKIARRVKGVLLPMTNIEPPHELKESPLWPEDLIPSLLANFYPHDVGLPCGNESWGGWFWYESLTEVRRKTNSQVGQLIERSPLQVQDRLWSISYSETDKRIDETSKYDRQKKKYITPGLPSYEAAAQQMRLLRSMLATAISRNELVSTPDGINVNDVKDWATTKGCIAKALLSTVDETAHDATKKNRFDHDEKMQKEAEKIARKMKEKNKAMPTKFQVAEEISEISAYDKLRPATIQRRIRNTWVNPEEKRGRKNK